MNVLIVVAHHDDLELGCGGTVAKLVERGHRVVSLVLTHSGYSDARGNEIRGPSIAGVEAEEASRKLGYTLVTRDEDTFDVPLSDANVRSILLTLEAYNIDTVFTHWHGDTHPAHQRVNAMVMHASRRIPRLFGFSVNWYIGAQAFAPQLFVAISETQWRRKIEALRCYESEISRTAGSWIDYLERQSLNFGAQLGVERAEAFVVYKHLWQMDEPGLMSGDARALSGNAAGAS